MKKIILLVMITLLIAFGLITLRFGSALTQEGNPTPYLISITKHELTNNGYEEVLETTDVIRYISKYDKEYPLGMAIEFMQRRGWVFNEQMGSVLIFEKDKELINISTRQYSKHYFIWDVPREILN